MNIEECQYHLTFDIDWAPDQLVADICEKLNARNIKATFFVTHPSDVIEDLKQNGHNIGLHPNFFPNSSQGKDPMKIMEYLLKIAPEAISFRSHGLFLSSSLLLQIASNFPQIKYDLSVFLYKFPLVAVTDFIYDDVVIKRINYNWEDDIACFDSQFVWNEIDPFAQTMVFDFHPIHTTGLNSNNLDNYKALKSNLNGRPLYDATPEEISKYRNPALGAENYLDSIISSKMKSIDFDALTVL